MKQNLNEPHTNGLNLKKLENKFNDASGIIDNKISSLYDTMVKGDAQLYAELKILQETVFKIKGDLRRYLFISSAWIGWWFIHLLNKIIMIYT